MEKESNMDINKVAKTDTAWDPDFEILNFNEQNKVFLSKDGALIRPADENLAGSSLSHPKRLIFSILGFFIGLALATALIAFAPYLREG